MKFTRAGNLTSLTLLAAAMLIAQQASAAASDASSLPKSLTAAIFFLRLALPAKTPENRPCFTSY